MHQAKATILFVMPTLLSVVISHYAYCDDSLRCGSNLVRLGDSKLSVIQNCGDPHNKETVSGYPHDYDIWTYNLGYGDFIYTLKFQGDKLKAIEKKGRGHTDPNKPQVFEQKRGSKVEIVDWTTDTRSVATWVKGILRNTGNATAEEVRVTVTALDQNGMLVNLEEMYANQSTLPPGADTVFDIPIKNDPNIRKYEVKVRWKTQL